MKSSLVKCPNRLAEDMAWHDPMVFPRGHMKLFVVSSKLIGNVDSCKKH
jgi:hypothetical protein